MRSHVEENTEHIYPQNQVIREDPLSLLPRLAGKLRTFWLARTYPFAALGKGTWAHYSVKVARSAARYISIGENVALARDARLEICGTPQGDSPILVIEENCGIQRRCLISAQNRIHIMRNVIFGHSAMVMDHSNDLLDSVGSMLGRNEAGRGTIRIEEGCWIGSRARIVSVKGELVIGRNSVIGANCLITQSVPSYSIVIGNPPSIVRQYDLSKGKWVLGSVRPGNAPGEQP
jgi:acetyltransferase-like isoleucine patch superfamily enzyme